MKKDGANLRISIDEEKHHSVSVYKKIVTDTSTGEVVFMKAATCPLKKVKENDFTYFILYNDSMNPIKDAFEYLNYDLRNFPLTSRSKAATALRFLYCFLELAPCRVNQISFSVLREFQMFLQGLGVSDSGPLKTMRSASTINNYFATYRDYFQQRNIPCEPLFSNHMSSTDFILPGSETIERKDIVTYSSSMRNKRPNIDTTPKYISPDDFKKLFRAALKNQDKTAQILMHLMYGYGLRLGESLGLTIEDITEVHIDGQLVPVLYIRNRISDRKFQFAKGLAHPMYKEQYRTKDYTASRHRIIITYEFYEQLIDYINEVHEEAMAKYPKNYKTGEADIVSYRDKPETNHYVFLNRYGRVLSDQAWNDRLRKYFVAVGIPIDIDQKENNLSHRFRHGFAMFHARFSEHPVNSLELQKMLRHKSISSTLVYYNPTPEDELETKTAFQKELYDMIPELKEGWKNESDTDDV